MLVDVMISQLRKAVTVPDDVWDVIKQEALESGGLTSLTGSSQLIVESAMRKHGSPGQKGYAQMHPKGSGGGGASGGGQSGSQGASASRPAAGPAKLDSTDAQIDAARRAADISGADGNTPLKADQIQDTMRDVIDHKPVPVKAKGVPEGTKGKVVGYREDDDSRVFVAFDSPVSINGVRDTMHEMKATFDQSRGDNEYMTELTAL